MAESEQRHGASRASISLSMNGEKPTHTALTEHLLSAWMVLGAGETLINTWTLAKVTAGGGGVLQVDPQVAPITPTSWWSHPSKPLPWNMGGTVAVSNQWNMAMVMGCHF